MDGREHTEAGWPGAYDADIATLERGSYDDKTTTHVDG